MPISIIDVDVNDEKFKAFVDVFNKYKAAVKELPADWGKQGEAIEGVSQSFLDMTSALMAQKEMFEQNREAAKKQASEERQKETADSRKRKTKADEKKKADKEEKDRLKQEEAETKRRERDEVKRREAVSKSHEKAKKDTKAIAKNIGQASVNLLKWVSVDAVVGGLLGGGGLFGLDKLADHTANLRLESNRLGVTVGEKRSTDLNLGGFLDSPATLENFAQAKSDLASRWAFAALGLNPNNTDPAELLATAAPRAKKLFVQGGQTEQFATATGLTKLFSMNDLRSLANTDDSELAERLRDLKSDKDKFNLPKDIQKQWFDFSRALKGAGVAVESALIRGLSPLAAKLPVLSDAFAKSLEIFLKTPEFGKWLDEAATGIKNLGDYLGSPKFQADVKTFATDIELIAEAIVRALKWLQIIPDSGTAPSPGAPAGAPNAPPLQSGAFTRGTVAALTGNLDKLSDSQFKAYGENVAFLESLGWSYANAVGFVTNGIAESGLNPGKKGDFNSKTGRFESFGAFQWHETDKQLAAKNGPWDEYANWAAGRKDIKHKALQGSELWEQEEFLNYQLTQGSEKDAAGKIRFETEPGASADAIARWFERPKNSALQAAIRSSEAGSLDEQLRKRGIAHDRTIAQAIQVQTQSAETATPATNSLGTPNYSNVLLRLLDEAKRKNSGGAGTNVSVNVNNATGGSAVVSTNSLAAGR